tara:strand:+ start:69 stop:1163 length:1095 start_codon:yes stop_codon:yes gene_type:complete
MAKQLTTFMPGAFTATTTLTYKEHRYMGAWGEDMNGCGNATGDYGHSRHFLDRDDTPCTESNNRHIMRRTVDKNYGTEVFAITSSGAGGGACCCMSSSTGQGGMTWKFSPRWSTNCADSDTMRMCIPMSSGCCHPACIGCCSEPYTFCVGGGTGVLESGSGHPYTGSDNSGQPGVFCGSFMSGCGAASTCNYHFQPCCNYGAMNSGGGFRHPCCCVWDTGRASCYTTCKTLDELPFAACDQGYDCFLCAYRIGGNFESGSCINRESSGVCGIVMFSGTSIAKTQIFRQGVVSAHSTTRCEMAQGGWTGKCDRACLYGVNPQKSGYWTAGMALTTAHVCGGPCCCGSQAAGGMVRVIYDDGNPNP